MEDKTNLEVKKKIGKWNKEIDINFKELFRSLSSGTIAYFIADAPKIIESGISLIDTVKLKDKPQTLAYYLIFNSIERAIIEIINENTDKLETDFKTISKFEEYKEFQDLIQEIELTIEEHELEIGLTFFDQPTKISILDPLIEILVKWFVIFGFDDKNAKVAAKKLKSYYVFMLHDLWRKNNEKFQPLVEQLETPFNKATQIEIEWKYYNSYLQKQIERPIFNETFGLKEIFIPLNGYYEQKIEDEEGINYIKKVVDVSQFIEDWIDKSINSEDCLKVICGGPGSGKSTMAKLLASKLSEASDLNVVYIPLQHLNIKDDLTNSVGDYLKESNNFEHNPLELIYQSANKLLLIFDGLDELSKQGKHAYELSKNFIEEIQRKTSIINNDSNKIYILITGRELTIQNQSMAFRRHGQILHLLPYFNLYEEEFKDEKKLLKKDLRNEWWENYGKLKSFNYTRFPEELKNPNLDEITSQPLLNYLVALTYERNNIDFNEDTNLNEIFRDLIKAVFDRQYEKKQHKVISELRIDENNFFRVLEEVAISAWHSGDIRTTTIKKIDKHIADNNLKSFFKEFQMGVQAGISRLLTAFYFRQKGLDNNQNKTFEFTHKSFGEYLASRRIVNFLMLISTKINRHEEDPDEGINRKDALKKIIETLGVMPIDNYLFSFLQNEIKLVPIEKVEILQNNIIQLIEYAATYGMPVELISPRPTFEEEQSYYRNSMLALFASLKITSDHTNIKSNIIWPNDRIFGEIISNLRALKLPKSEKILRRRRRRMEIDDITDHSSILNNCFSNMIIENCQIASLDLTYSNFSNSELKNVILAGSDLFGSRFYNTKFINVNFYRANLKSSSFVDASFENMKFGHLLRIEQLNEASVLQGFKGLNDRMSNGIDKELKRREKEERRREREFEKKQKLVENERQD